MGESEIQEVPVQDKYKVWIDEVRLSKKKIERKLKLIVRCPPCSEG